MPGTILLDDWKQSIQDQLGSYANGLTSAAQQAVAPVALIPTPQTPDPNAILAELQQHAQDALAASQQQAQQIEQPALQVLGQGVQAAGGAVTQLGGAAQQAKDQIAQQLVQHAQDAADTRQQLQDHVATVLGGTDVNAPAGVQSLAVPKPAPVLGGVTGDQSTPALGATTGPVNQSQTPTTTPPAGGFGSIDSSSPSAFAKSFAPYAQYAAQKLGIDPTWVAAMAASESNYGKAGGNELFGIKALPGQPGTSMQTHEGEYGGTNMAQTFASYDSPLDAVNAYVDLLKNHYQGAVGAQDLPTFIHGLKQGGYFTAAEPEYLGIVKGIGDRIGGDVQAGLQGAGQAVGNAASALGTGARAAVDTASTAMNQSQFGDPQLTAAEAEAACGPAAAVRFAERFGRNPTLREATDLAAQVGWTSSGGMAGITSEQALLKNMGVDTHVVAPDWNAIATEAQTGNPVTISTPGHYYFADGYNAQNGTFHVGRSGLDLKGGSEWMTPTQMENLMGGAQGALFADNPSVPSKGAANAPVALGGASGTTQNAPLMMGANEPAKAPLVVQDQTPTPIQSAQDVLGQAVGGAASALGTAAQQAVQGAQQAAAPILGGAQQAISGAAQALGGAAQAGGTAVNQVAQDVQQAAQGTLQTATPVLGGAASAVGTAARGAADVLGATASDVGAGAQSALGTVQQTADDLGAQRDAFAQSPIGQRLMQAAVENAQAGPSLLPGLNPGGATSGSVSLYQDIQQAKNDWIAQNNPLNNLPGAKPAPGHEQDLTPGGLIAGLTTGIAQQFTDPVMLSLLGPTSSLAEVGKEAVGKIVGDQLADRVAPGAAKVLTAVAEKFTSGAIVGGLQNAMFEAEKKDATPESVGTALVTGAGLGGVIDLGLAPVMPIVRRLGQVLLDNAPQIRPAVAQFARSETGAVGRPEDVRALAAEQAGTPQAPETTAETAESRPSNPYDLPRAAPEPNTAPLSNDQVLSHLAQLDQQHTANETRIAELQNQLAGGTAAPGDGAELTRLQADQAQLDSAHNSIWDYAGGGGDVYARPTTEGLPSQGGVDAGAAQAAGGVAPANAEAAGGRGEAGAGVPGAYGASEPTARAEPAATELAFRAPETMTPPAAATGRPVEGLPGVTQRTVQGAEPPNIPAATNLADVHSNPHLLNEAAAGETPMTQDERLAHQDTLEQRYQANQDRLAAIDEQLRNPTAKPERPPWGGGWTNDQLVSIAKAHGESAYSPLWWERAGLDAGSGEVRENVGEGGFRNPNATREPTPQELRQERNTLALDQRDLVAAGEQQATAPDNARFVRRQQSAAALPFAGGEESAPHGPYATEQASSGPGSLAEDIVTQNGRKPYGDPLQGDGLREAPGEVVGTRGGITGTGISDINAEAVRPGEPSAATLRRMPNLDAMLKGEMPEVRAQIQRAAEDNPQLFDAYRQGRISHDSLVTDLATKVGMTREQWLKTPVGKGFSTEEMVALQAAAIDAQARSTQMAKDIVDKGGVDALTPEQVAYGLNELVNNTRLLSVARGGRSSAGRTLNALKIRLDATMARGINASNERIGAQRLAAQAKAAVARATKQLESAKELDAEKNGVVSRLRKGEFNAGPAATPPTTEAEQLAARERGYQNIPEERRGPVGPGTPTEMPGTPSPRQKPPSASLIDQIANAYDELDRYNAMTLHEKADVQAKRQAERDALAAKRQAVVRGAPEELLSALKKELAWEQANFAKRKDTWETMAFWDSKANENAIAKRNAFRGGLYIEQYRKSADLAAKSAEADAKRAWDLESKRQSIQTQKATTLLEALGGATPSRELLKAYVDAVNSDDPLAAGKFVKGLMTPGWWGRVQTLRIAGLLSSTVTHMANMVGNITQVPLEAATHALTVPIDWARATATGGRRQAYMAELGPMLEAYGPGFAASMSDAVKILQTGISPADAVKLENIRPGIASGSGKVDAVLEGPLRALQAEDELFRGGAFAMQAKRVATRYAYREGFRGEQLAGRTSNIIKNLETYPDLYKEAHDAMLRMVFQEHRDWIPSPRGPVRGVVSQPLPFIKTPANITAQGMGLSPFGVAGSIQAVGARRALEASGKATEAQLDRATLLAEQRIARTAIGTAIFGLGVGLGAGTFSGGKSMLTGAYDPNEASTYPQGWREWSMVTEDPVSGNTYYVPLQNFGAAGAPLAMAAIVTDAAKRGHSLLDENEAQRAATSIGQYVLDNTFLQGLSDTVNVLHDPSRYANKFLESLVSSYGPFSALGRQVQRAYGVASRNPHDGLMGLVEAMESNYPGLSGNVPESLTAIGEPRTQGISGAAAFALPFRADIMRDEPTLQALRANDVRIPPAAKAVNVGGGWAIDLTPEEQDQLQRARGEILRQQVAAVQNSTLYKNGDISVRNQLLSKAVSAASQNSDVLFTRSLSDADIKARAVRKTVPTPYTVAGESAA